MCKIGWGGDKKVGYRKIVARCGQMAEVGGPFKCYVTLFFLEIGTPSTHPLITLITLNLTPL